VQQLLKDLGHQLESVKPAIFESGLPVQQIHSYVNSIFGDFDEDGNGSIGFMEFKRLWEHLG
jgi:Ca2+-binding EF-hand superfamily protein